MVYDESVIGRVDNIIDYILENVNISLDLINSLKYIFNELYQEFPLLKDIKLADKKIDTESSITLEFSNKNTMQIGETFMIVYSSSTLKHKYIYTRYEDSYDSYLSSILGLMRIEALDMMKNIPMIKSSNKN